MAFAQVISTKVAGFSAAAVVAVAPSQESADDCFEELGDCSNQLAPGAGDLAPNAVLIGAVFLGVLAFGLWKIKRQRDEGRRSKLPPIG